MRKDMVKDIREMLLKADFKVSHIHDMRSVSFDLVARRDNTVLFLKAVTNIDAFSEENAEELKLLSRILGGSPIAIGLHSGSGQLDDDVVYTRFSIPIMTPSTFHQFVLEDVPPIVVAAPGGYYVKLDGKLLREIREERGISLGELADRVGVSRRSIQLYEEGGRRALVDVAMRIEDCLDIPLSCPVDPLEAEYEIKLEVIRDSLSDVALFCQEAFTHLMQTGCHIISTSRSPFETVVEEKQDVMLTGVAKYERTLLKKAKVIGDVSCIIERQSMVVVDRRPRRESIEGTAVVGVKEILERGSLEDILELIQERAKNDHKK